MGVLGELVVRVLGDTTNVNKALTDTEKKSEKLGKKFVDMAKKMEAAGKKLTMRVTLPILALGAAALKASADFEKQRVAFETMLGSAEDAKELLEDLETFAAATPFQLPGLMEGTKRLLAFGIEAEDVIVTMENLGNAAMGDQAKLDQLTDAFGKVAARGKASMRELNMFLYAGVPIIDALAEGFDVTTEELFKMSEQGKVTFDDVNKALISMTTGTGMFAGMIQKQSQTMAGLFSTLKDNLLFLVRDFGDVYAPMIKEFLDKGIAFIQRLREMGEGTRKVVINLALFAAAVGPLLIVIPKLILTMKTLFATFTVGAGPIALIATAIAGVIVGITLLSTRMRTAKEETQLVNDAMEGNLKTVEEYEKALEILNRRNESTVEVNKRAAPILAENTKKLEALEKASKLLAGGVKEGGENWEEYIGYLKDVGYETEVFANIDEHALYLMKDHLRSTAVLSDATKAFADYKEDERKITENLNEAKEEEIRLAEEMEEALKAQIEEQERLTAALLKQQKSLQAIADEIKTNVKKELEDVDKLYAEFGDEIDVTAEKQQILKDALREAITKGLDPQKATMTMLRKELKEYGEEVEETGEKLQEIFEDDLDRELEYAEEVSMVWQRKLDDKKAKLEKEEEAEKEHVENMKTIRQGLLDASIRMIGYLNTIIRNSYDSQLQDLRELYDAKIEAAGENADLVATLQKELDDQEKQLMYDAAKRSKKLSLFEAVITGAQAIISGFSSKPFLPVGLAMGALASALVGAQIAAIASKPLPALAAGGIYSSPVIVGEGGPEAALPLTDEVLGKLGNAIAKAGKPMTNVINQGDSMINLQVSIGPEVIYDHITKAIQDRKILVDKGAVA